MASFIRFKFPLPVLALFLFSFPATASIEGLRDKIRDASARASLDPLLVEAVVATESNYKEKARSHKGAAGLMQVMPRTAGELGIRNPYHAVDNLMGACLFLRKMLNRYRGNMEKALAAYNAGPHHVDRYGGIPPFPETIRYVERVLNRYAALKKRS